MKDYLQTVTGPVAREDMGLPSAVVVTFIWLFIRRPK